MTPVVLYRGPSRLDGQPIVALATLGSVNVKTGPMVQTWIMRADMPPMQASAHGADASVCGACPRRHSLHGDCYVVLIQAPRSVWAHWDRSGRPGANWSDPDCLMPLTSGARDHGLRLGSYGDPAAVPWDVWADLMDALQPKLHTGYTHQWRGLSMHDDWYRTNLMASCDTLAEAYHARSLGWRYFLAVGPGVVPPTNTVECLAERDVNPKHCHECGICDGTQGKVTRTSVYLVEHGGRSQAKHRRSLSAVKPQTMVVL